MMKKSLFLIFVVTISSFSYSQKDPVLMTVDGKEVRQSEFISIYTKNNPNPKYDKTSLDEYMDLFIKYKLKVTEAENLQMDTISKFQRELAGYREQLAEPYLTDKEVNEQLVRDAYFRQTNQIKASHILIQDVNAKEASRNPKPAGKAELDRINEIRNEIVSGEISFEDAAVKYSQDPSAAKGQGSLGYFGAFQMVYSFEDAAYNTPVGEISQPVKTRFGYHLIKVYDQRKTKGQILTAHIYIKAPDNSSEREIAQAKRKIDEIYERLQKGEDFAELAKKYSEDKTSSSNGGKLNWFSEGKLLPEFEEAAFALENNDDYSKPVKSSYGFHIIKRLDYKPVPLFEQMEGELKRKIAKDARSNKSKASFVNKLKKEYHFKDYSHKWMTDLTNEYLKPDSLFDTDISGRLEEYYDNKAFRYSIKGGWFAKKNKVYAGELVNLLVDKTAKEKLDVQEEYDNLVNKTLIDFEKSRLEEKYPEYKALMKEYKDGILLFELTDQKVWKKASRDTTGLKAFYEKNKENYLWGKRADVEIYTSNEKAVLNDAMDLAKKGKNGNEILKEINRTSELNLNLDSDIYEIDQKEELKDKDLVVGINGPFNLNDKFYFVKVHRLIDPEPKKLEDTRGMVISDYQNQLEKEWIKELKAKYPITINEKVLYSLGDK